MGLPLPPILEDLSEHRPGRRLGLACVCACYSPTLQTTPKCLSLTLAHSHPLWPPHMGSKVRGRAASARLIRVPSSERLLSLLPEVCSAEKGQGSYPSRHRPVGSSSRLV